MLTSTVAILVILLIGIIVDQEGEMFSLDQLRQCPSKAATFQDGESPAAGMVNEMRRVESIDNPSGHILLLCQECSGFVCGNQKPRYEGGTEMLEKNIYLVFQSPLLDHHSYCIFHFHDFLRYFMLNFIFRQSFN